MNELKLLTEQIKRETACVNQAQEKLRKDVRKNEKNTNASNNFYGVSLKRQYLGDMVAELQRQIDKVKTIRQGHKAPEKYSVLQTCLGIVFERYKGEKHPKYVDLFSAELACHIALQLTLDAVMLPNTIPSKNKRSTKIFDGCRPTMAELQDEIGKQLWRQMKYRLLDMNFGKYFNKLHDKARGTDAAKSSPHYVFNTLDWHIQQFRELCRDDERDVVFQFHEWDYREREIIGSWLLTLVNATGLFKQVQSTKSSREQTLELSDLGRDKIEALTEQVENFIALPLPMIVPPVPMTKDTLGGWIGDAAVLNSSTNNSWKGSLEISDLHLDFYNHQQEQAFRINPFIYELLSMLNEQNIQLGKFKAYKKQRLIPMWQEMGITSYEWNNCESKAEQDSLIHADKAKFKKVCANRSKRYTEEFSKHMEGKPSEYLFDMATDCLNDDELYIPIEPDFRSRFTCRTSYLSYQGNDVARGLLEFADGHKIDSHTKRFLSIHLANQAGMDKESYARRIDWVEQHLDVIEAVALMTAGDDELQEGIALINDYADEHFQFAAACREYYELFIAKTKSATYLPCAIDATCSGQQLIAGFLRSGELAERVNVLPTNKPGDIYRDTMDRMLELAAEDEIARFTPKTVKAFKGSVGRKVSKKGFMSGQYGSGTKRQLADMYAYLDDETDLELKESEKLLIKKYWADALEDICKIRVVFNWFKDLVEEIHDAGKSEVIIPTPTGSRIHQRYPAPKTVKVKTFSFGSSDYRESITNAQVPSDNRNLGKWKTATAANTIHGAGDASLICLALHNFEHSFYCVHDSIASHAGKPMEALQKRLKQAYVDVVSFDLWNAIREANGLPTDETKLPALSNDLDIEQVKHSNYLFC